MIYCLKLDFYTDCAVCTTSCCYMYAVAKADILYSVFYNLHTITDIMYKQPKVEISIIPLREYLDDRGIVITCNVCNVIKD